MRRRGRDRPLTQREGAFQALLAEGGLAAFERQLRFEARVGDPDWLLDQGSGTLTLGDDLSFPAQLLGSSADQSATWLWAWANPTVEPSMANAAERARSLGRERGIDILTEREFPLESVGDGHFVALAVAGALEADAYYRCPYDGGAAFVLVELPRHWRDAPDIGPSERVGTVVRSALASIPELVTRPAVEAYLTMLGIRATAATGPISVDGGLTLRFDDHGRLTALEETLGS